MNRLIKAGVRLADRLVPKADVDAAQCGCTNYYCGYCQNGRKAYSQCCACSDGTYTCTPCQPNGDYCTRP